MPRPKGSRNKPKQALLNLLQDKYPGWQPVASMAEGAQVLIERARQASKEYQALLDDETSKPEAVFASLKVEVELWTEAITQCDKVAQYVTPKLKAVELSTDDDQPLTIGLVQFASDRPKTD